MPFYACYRAAGVDKPALIVYNIRKMVGLNREDFKAIN